MISNEGQENIQPEAAATSNSEKKRRNEDTNSRIEKNILDFFGKKAKKVETDGETKVGAEPGESLLKEATNAINENKKVPTTNARKIRHN